MITVYVFIREEHDAAKGQDHVGLAAKSVEEKATPRERETLQWALAGIKEAIEKNAPNDPRFAAMQSRVIPDGH